MSGQLMAVGMKDRTTVFVEKLHVDKTAFDDGSVREAKPTAIWNVFGKIIE